MHLLNTVHRLFIVYDAAFHKYNVVDALSFLPNFDASLSGIDLFRHSIESETLLGNVLLLQEE